MGLDRCDGLAGRGTASRSHFDGAQGERPHIREGRHETCPYEGGRGGQDTRPHTAGGGGALRERVW